ncbi:MAG TPA: type II toxin-antitoxin system prevent-host-death family antitoxin [Pseudonocardia sp.]|jgi:prevent-host-death family protein|uniref:type II toxin-antitoxin system Phd/YefM family antitoxin n=1 Tax=Pseudonocardia sp. TaxID=60912 RepID=UPI002BE795D5|nr:type II toxin-antitoxin system prevent-host-death family antitoxin [Pseudonocardia sp.]HTF49138.1 type II toxin-antitoxin system prevent-host-death family antitoxin [Pseudonocardia sp.]
MAQPEPESDSIGIRELRQHASRYVAMAKAGKRIPVTERGKLVAYLVPAEEPTSMFERMVAAGQVRLATGNLMDLLPPPASEPGEKSLSETLREMRDEERY